MVSLLFNQMPPLRNIRDPYTQLDHIHCNIKLNEVDANLTTMASNPASTIEGPYGSEIGSVCTCTSGFTDYPGQKPALFLEIITATSSA